MANILLWPINIILFSERMLTSTILFYGVESEWTKIIRNNTIQNKSGFLMENRVGHFADKYRFFEDKRASKIRMEHFFYISRKSLNIRS